MMEKDSLKNYFKYVRDVLGIKQIFNKNSKIDSSISELLIVVDGLNDYSSVEKVLLEKMILALNLKSEQFKLQDSATDESSYHFKLHLVDGDAHESANHNIAVTYSPKRLLAQPELKKPAWAAMQNLIKKINS